MAELSARDELQLSEAVNVLFRLLSVDRAWTAIAQRPVLAGEDVDLLSGIAEQLRGHIAETVEAAYTLVRIARLADPPSEVGEEARLLPEVRAFYNAVVAQAGGVVPLAEQAYKEITEMAEDERETLDNQLATLRAGGRVDGDLSRRFLCRFAKVLMVAGGITVWVPPHAHAGASVAAGVSIATANRCWDLEPAFQNLG